MNIEMDDFVELCRVFDERDKGNPVREARALNGG